MTGQRRYLTQSHFSAQHRWLDLWHYIYCFVQLGEAFTVEGNKHTHACTHTHTQTNTHKQSIVNLEVDNILILGKSLNNWVTQF